MTDLGRGWVQAADASGKIYYANTITGASAWEFPAELLPPGWVAAADPSSGRPYFVELATQRTQWEVPQAAPPAPAPAAAAPPPPAPVRAQQKHRQVILVDTVAPCPADVQPPAGKTLSAPMRAKWKAVMDYARQESTAKIAARNKKFSKIKGMAKVIADKKKEAAAKKAAEADEAAQLEKDLAAAIEKKKRRNLLTFLNVDVPDIERKNIEEYAESSFELRRKGVFKSVTTVHKVLSWKDEVIGMALLKMPTSDLNATAIQCFKNITGFMGDRTTGKDDGGHAEKLLKTTLHAPVELRDEVFCQIIKQTTNNPSAPSNLKGWQLMGVVAGALAPSKDLEPYLFSYCNSHKDETGGVGEYAKYALGRLIKMSKLGPRREVPPAMEIDAAKARMPVLMRVYYLDGAFDTLPITSWTTSVDLKEMVCEKKGMLDGEAFGVYEMTPKGEERLLDPDERVLDIVAYWQRLFEEERGNDDEGGDKKKKKKATGNNFYRIVFKVKHYFEPDTGDVEAQHMMYIQAAYDVVSARYPCGERDCLALASLQLQAEYADAGLPELKEHLERYLPIKLADSTRKQELANEITKLHTTHAGKTPLAAEKEYLAYVKEWQVYGSSFFFVQPQMSDLPRDVFLAVNPKGVLIIDPESKTVLATHPYSEVPTWGYSSTSFALHVGNLIKQTKIYFGTDHGKEINDLIRAYVNHLCVA